MELRIGPSKRYVGVTSKGLMFVRGAKSIAEARRLLKETARQVVPSEPVQVTRFKVRNIVVTTDFGRMFDMNNIVRESIFELSDYEPELFPGLTVRFTGTKCTVLLFSSGKAVVTGARSLKEVRQTITRMDESLSKP
jgi:transcription initiation factor TFIID TATA-box-binding protein